jgi:glyoxalase family protein
MRLSCINIPTPNAKRLANFYKKILGANIDETHGGPERIEIWFGNDKQNSVLLVATQDLEYRKSKTTACQGFEFYVSDVDAEYKRLIDLGIKINQHPKNLPWNYRYFHINDPDENGIDIVQKL